MNLDRAVERARSVNGQKTAARLYADTEFELAMGEPTDEQEQQGEEALRVLEQRFPGIKSHADDVVENGHVPNLSRKGWGNVNRPRGEHSASGSRPARRPHIPQQPKPTIRRPSPRTGRRGSSRGSFGGSLLSATGASSAADSTAEMLMKLIGLIAGLSLLYVVLKPNGSRALQLASSGLTKGVDVLVNPAIDPLRPVQSAQQATIRQTSGQAARQVLGGQGTGGIANQIAGQITAIANSVGTGASHPNIKGAVGK
jgi:hypothetical protein